MNLPYRIGLVADNPNFPAAWDNVVAKAKIADELGYTSIWLGETWGYDIFTSLSDIMRATQHIQLGVGIANVFSRSPGVIASTAATLDERSNGRVILGLGSSGPQVIEHWHGVQYTKPLSRIKEYVEIINMMIRREPLQYHGDIFQLERGFKLQFKPVREHIPIYLASLTPKSIEQTGAIADGVLPTFWPLDGLHRLRDGLVTGAATVGRDGNAIKIAPYLTSAVIVEESQRDEARALARNPIAWYIGRMGTFYADMLRRNGYEEEVEAVIAGWQNGPKTAALGVSDRLLDATAIVGTPTEVANRVHDWVTAGAEEPLLSLPPGDPEVAGYLLAELKSALILRAKLSE